MSKDSMISVLFEQVWAHCIREIFLVHRVQRTAEAPGLRK